jgi:hypothetical protein
MDCVESCTDQEWDSMVYLYLRNEQTLHFGVGGDFSAIDFYISAGYKICQC